MQILYNPNLVTNLKNSVVFIDNNTLIAALSYPNLFGHFLLDLSKQGCTFITINAVVFEFSRGATDTIEGFEKRIDFVKDLATIYPIERHLEQIQDFVLVLSKINKKLEYSDFLLLASLFRFPKAYLLTENHNHVPLEIFDRLDIVTLDTDKDLRTHGLYCLSQDKYEKAAANILS